MTEARMVRNRRRVLALRGSMTLKAIAERLGLSAEYVGRLQYYEPLATTERDGGVAVRAQRAIERLGKVPDCDADWLALENMQNVGKKTIEYLRRK